MSTLTRSLAYIGLQPRRRATAFVAPALGLLGTGLAVGAGLGMLFAPRRGTELRRDIKDKARKSADAAATSAKTTWTKVATKATSTLRRPDTGHVEAHGKGGPDPETIVVDETSKNIDAPGTGPDHPFSATGK
jgi:hypothetical protein